MYETLISNSTVNHSAETVPDVSGCSDTIPPNFTILKFQQECTKLDEKVT